jgi:hypothetical protein
MSIGAIPKNIANLVDNQAYKVGDNNQIDTSGGKGLFTFKSTQAAKNQAVLTNVVNQMKQAFGQDSFNPAGLTLPPDVASGKRAITGADIKKLANDIKMRVDAKINTDRINTAATIAAKPGVRAGSSSILRNLGPVLAAKAISPSGVVKAFREGLQNVAPDIMKDVIKTAISQLGEAQLIRLSTVILDSDVQDMSKIMNGLLQSKHIDPPPSTANLATAKVISDMLPMITDGIREAQAEHKTGWDIQHGMGEAPIPENYIFKKGRHGAFDASPEVKQAFNDMGIDIVQLAKTSLQSSVSTGDVVQSMRSNELGEQAVRSMFGSRAQPQIPTLLTQLKNHFPPTLKGLDTNTLRERLDSTPEGRAFQTVAANFCLQNPVIRQVLTDAIAFLRDEVKDLTPDDQHGERMMRCLVNTTILPALPAALIDSTDPEIKQLGNALQSCTTHSTFQQVLSSLPGYAELVGPKAH